MADQQNETATAEGARIETGLSRDMGLFDITFIGVGAMIGAGVIALTEKGDALCPVFDALDEWGGAWA